MSELAVRQRGDRAVFAVVFLMLFAFSYSEQLVSGVFPIVGGNQTAWRVAVVIVDAVVLALVGLMKGIVTRADGDAPRGAQVGIEDRGAAQAADPEDLRERIHRISGSALRAYPLPRGAPRGRFRPRRWRRAARRNPRSTRA